MRFDMEIHFDSGRLEGAGIDTADLAQIGRLLVAFAEGHDKHPIEIEGGRMKSVGDIRSIRVEAIR